MTRVIRSLLRILVGLFVAIQIVAFLSLDFLMFRPVKGGYDASSEGYVDIGTNGVRIAADDDARTQSIF